VLAVVRVLWCAAAVEHGRGKVHNTARIKSGLVAGGQIGGGCNCPAAVHRTQLERK
jgi:hypothetical protein